MHHIRFALPFFFNVCQFFFPILFIAWMSQCLRAIIKQFSRAFFVLQVHKNQFGGLCLGGFHHHTFFLCDSLLQGYHNVNFGFSRLLCSRVMFSCFLSFLMPFYKHDNVWPILLHLVVLYHGSLILNLRMMISSWKHFTIKIAFSNDYYTLTSLSSGFLCFPHASLPSWSWCYLVIARWVVYPAKVIDSCLWGVKVLLGSSPTRKTLQVVRMSSP